MGGFAGTVAVDAQMVFALPENVPFDKAAALPLNYLTVHFALTRRARLRSGEIVLVQGAAGGVGSVACQMAAAMGARVIAVVSSTEKGDIARRAGAHEVVLADGFRDEIKRITGDRGVGSSDPVRPAVWTSPDGCAWRRAAVAPVTPDGQRSGFSAVARRGRLVAALGQSYSQVHGNIRPTLWRSDAGAPLREVELLRELFGGGAASRWMGWWRRRRPSSPRGRT